MFNSVMLRVSCVFYLNDEVERVKKEGLNRKVGVDRKVVENEER